ncbi:MAG TPA: protein kinase [Planctomycetota bacterium]|nr:protein kinase [Planctomycetota bacterium]
MSDAPSIPGFRVGTLIGRGSSATVWRAVDERDGATVALKVMAIAGGDDTARFLREAAAAQALSHPRVVACRGSGRHDDALWLALEFVPGGDAAGLARAAGGRLDERQALAIARDAAEGLEALSAAGLVHRDVKPANLLIDGDGRAKLADLGLTRTGDDALTRTGAVLGTPAFMAPEQARGDRAIDPRADIYALGATLYALVVGQPPFSGETPWAVMGKVLRDPVPDPRALQPDISGQCRAIIRCCLAKDPGQRYADARELREDLAAAIAGGIPAHAGRIRARGRGGDSPPEAPSPLAGDDAATAPRPWALIATTAALFAIAFIAGRWSAARAVDPPELLAARGADDTQAWYRLSTTTEGEASAEACSRMVLSSAILVAGEDDPAHEEAMAATRTRLSAERDALAAAQATLRDARAARGAPAVAPPAPAAPQRPPVSAAAVPATPTPTPVDGATEEPAPSPADAAAVAAAQAIARAIVSQHAGRASMQLDLPAKTVAFSVDPRRPSDVVAIGSDGAVHRSRDGGAGWDAPIRCSVYPQQRAACAIRGPAGDGSVLIVCPTTRDIGAWSPAGGTFAPLALPHRAATPHPHRIALLDDGRVVALIEDDRSQRRCHVLDIGAQRWRQDRMPPDLLDWVFAWRGGAVMIRRGEVDGTVAWSVDLGVSWDTHRDQRLVAFGSDPDLLVSARVGDGVLLFDRATGTFMRLDPGMAAPEIWRRESIAETTGDLSAIQADLRDPRVLYGLSALGFMVSRDAGSTWWIDPLGLPSGTDRRMLAVADGHALVLWERGAARHPLPGAEVELRAFDEHAQRAIGEQLFPYPGGFTCHVIASTLSGALMTSNRVSVKISHNHGVTWQAIGLDDIRVIFGDPKRASQLGLMHTGNLRRLFLPHRVHARIIGALSVDGGRTFAPVRIRGGEPRPDAFEHCSTMLRDGTLVSVFNEAGDAAWPRVLSTSDDGKRWRVVARDVPELIALAPTHDGAVLVALRDDPLAIVASADLGRTWKTVAPRTAKSVGSTYACAAASDRVLVWDDEGRRILAIGLDGAPISAIDAADSGLPHVMRLAVHPRDDRTVYALVSHGVLLRSRDGGATWRRAMGPLGRAVDDDGPRRSVISGTYDLVTYDTGTVLVSRQGELWRLDDAALGDDTFILPP